MSESKLIDFGAIFQPLVPSSSFSKDRVADVQLEGTSAHASRPLHPEECKDRVTTEDLEPERPRSADSFDMALDLEVLPRDVDAADLPTQLIQNAEVDSESEHSATVRVINSKQIQIKFTDDGLLRDKAVAATRKRSSKVLASGTTANSPSNKRAQRATQTTNPQLQLSEDVEPPSRDNVDGVRQTGQQQSLRNSKARSSITCASTSSSAATATRFVNIVVAADEVGLPRSTVASWVSQSMVRNLKPGANNSHRLVDMECLRQLVAQRTEPALPRPIGAANKRTLFYTLLFPGETEHMSDDEVQRALADGGRDLRQRLIQSGRIVVADLPPGLQQLYWGEVGTADEIAGERVAFSRVIDAILARDIDVLVIRRPERCCEPQVFRFLEWLCARNHVSIVCAETAESHEER